MYRGDACLASMHRLLGSAKLFWSLFLVLVFMNDCLIVILLVFVSFTKLKLPNLSTPFAQEILPLPYIWSTSSSASLLTFIPAKNWKAECMSERGIVV